MGDFTREANELPLVDGESSTSLLVGVSSPLEKGESEDGGLSRLALVVFLLMGVNAPVDMLMNEV